MNKMSFTMVLDMARRTLEKKPKIKYNELRRQNSAINTTAEHFYLALTTEHKSIAPTDLRFTQINGKVDPNTVVDLEIEKA